MKVWFSVAVVLTVVFIFSCAQVPQQVQPLGTQAIPEDVAELIGRFSNRDASVRAYAAQMLGKIGERAAPAIPALIKLLDDNEQGHWGFDPIIGDAGAYWPNEEAAEALVKIGKVSVEPLIAALKGKNPEARELAAQALGKIGYPRAVEPLIAALETDKSNTYSYSEALGKIGKPAAEPLLRFIKGEKDTGKRIAAVSALARTGDTRAAEPAFEIYEEIGPRFEVELASGYVPQAYMYRGLVNALVKFGGRRGVEKVLPLLASQARWEVDKALTETGGAQVTEALAAEFADEESKIRDRAAIILGKLGDRRPVKHLLELLKSKSDKLRSQAAAALGKTRDPAVIKPLIEQLASSDYWSASPAAQALFDIGEPAVNSLIALLEDEDRLGRGYAAEILGRLKDKRASGPLIRALNNRDGSVRIAAARALGYLRDPRAVEPLTKVLGDPGCGFVAAEVLGEFGDKRAVEPLIAFLEKGYEAFCKAREQEEDEDDRELNVPGEEDEQEELTEEEKAFYELQRGGMGQENNLIETIRALGKLGDGRAVEPLMKLFRKECNRNYERDLSYGYVEKDEEWKEEPDQDPRYTDEFEALDTYGYWYEDWGDDWDLDDPTEPSPYSGDSYHTSIFITESQSVRNAAMQALIKIGSPSVEALVETLKDKNVYLRDHSAHMLGYIKDARAVRPLADALRDKSEWVRMGASRALYKLGKPSVGELVKALKRKNWRVRVAAAIALGGIEDKVAVKALIGALKDSNMVVSAHAAKSLLFRDRKGYKDWGEEDLFLHQTCKVALQPLLKLLKDKDPLYRQNAVRALRLLRKEPRVIEALAGALKDEDERVRVFAALSLAEAGDKRTVDCLISVIFSDKFRPHLRSRAPGLLAAIGDYRAMEPLLRASPWSGPDTSHIGDEAEEAAAKLANKASVEQLMGSLEDGSTLAKRYAGKALARRKDKKAVVPLIAAMKSKDNEVRRWAAFALGEIGDNRAIEVILEMLQDKDEEIRTTALFALAKLKDARAVQPLIKVLKSDPEIARRGAAAALLGELRDARAVEPLSLALENKSDFLQRKAIEALGNIGGAKAAQALVKAISPAYRGCNYISWDLPAEKLIGIGKEAVVPLVKALKDSPSASIRAAAAEILSQIRDKRVVEPLIMALKDNDDSVREYAAEALGKQGFEAAIKPLIEALGDENKEVRSNVYGALATLTGMYPMFGTDQAKWKQWYEKNKNE